MRIHLTLLTFLLISTTYFGVNYQRKSQTLPSQRDLRIVFPDSWGALEPPVQHTMLGDGILGNAFEALVDMEPGGMIVPFAAKSWHRSEDMRVFTFFIDERRRFSDGSPLSAADFKKSWEDGLKIESKFAQKSLMDLLYKIEGFENFAKSGTISGLQALDQHTLRIIFKTPFRMALDHLTGSRFAAYKQKSGSYIGTGPYVIKEYSQEKVQMARNPYAVQSVGFSDVTVSKLTAKACEEAVSNGDADVYAYASQIENKACGAGTLGCISGYESAHSLALVNGLPGRVFADRRLRQALQYLMTQNDSSSLQPDFDAMAARLPSGIDPQSFIELQSGRLEEADAKRWIKEGKPYLDLLIEQSQKTPLKVAYSSRSIIADQAIKLLRKSGVSLEQPLVTQNVVELQEILVKSIPDIAFASKSVVDGDPDGLYHAQGPKGAIVTPMTLREAVSKLLEEGRAITDINKLDEHYKKVSVAILQEVPYVHLGFLRDKTVYRSDRLKLTDRVIKSRIREPFAIFEPK